MNLLNATFNHGVFKAISAPLLDTTPSLSGELDASAWKDATVFFDMECDGKEPSNATEFRIFRDRSHLYIGGICSQGRIVVPNRPSKDGWHAFAGDGIEIMLGGGEPQPTLAMLRLSADGGRFSSGILLEQWEAACNISDNQWRFEIRLPLKALQSWSYKIGFNIFREDASTGEYQQWIPCEFSAHEIESLGELLLCNYDEAILYRTGTLPASPSSRTDYERTVIETASPSCRLASPPWLTNPTKHSIDVCFVTRSVCHAEVEYKPLIAEVWQKSSSDISNVHRLTIEVCGCGEYCYRILTKSSVYGKPEVSSTFKFKMITDDCDAKITACLLSDVHADASNLSRLLALPQASTADVIFDLGDISLQCTTGANSILESGLRLYSELADGGKPIVGLRGNHDHYGFYNHIHTKMLCGDGKCPYGAFRYGPVLFILLDNGVDIRQDAAEVAANQQLRDEQRQYLLKLKKTDDWKRTTFHVALTHMTAYNDKYGSQEFIRMLDGVFDDSPQNRLHALIGGHLHFYYSQMPHEDIFDIDMEWSSDHTPEVRIDRPPKSFPWLTLCIPAACGLDGDGDKASLLSLEADKSQLHLSLLSVLGEPKHTFNISPDGHCHS